MFKCSHTKGIFVCNDCGHEFESRLNDVTIKSRWCPYCNSYKLCENENCNQCYNKSFASHGKSKCWSKKNTEQPRNITKNSHTKYIFDCHDCGYEFLISPHSVNGGGGWCSKCVNKTEKKLFEYLKNNYENVMHQFKQSWCKKKNQLPFDFCLGNLSIIIELDGRQHFEQVSNWDCPVETQKTDRFKERCANENGYSVIRLIQKDVWNDTFDWKKELEKEINEIIQEKITRPEYVRNTYLWNPTTLPILEFQD